MARKNEIIFCNSVAIKALTFCNIVAGEKKLTFFCKRVARKKKLTFCNSEVRKTQIFCNSVARKRYKHSVTLLQEKWN